MPGMEGMMNIHGLLLMEKLYFSAQTEMPQEKILLILPLIIYMSKLLFDENGKSGYIG